ncbi:hypothetical protein [Halovenus marina]|uniref:hypothetical protein n=1 Tax=Halovenus marina TaxID=3396621 RepID=UPI003F54DB17
MTDKVHVSFGRKYRSREMSVARRYGSGDWVQPSAERLVADSEGELATGALNAFDESHSASSLDVTIDTGEALVRGAYLARDTTTTVTLPASATTTLYVGWQDGVRDTVIIGPASDFGSNDPKTEIWTIDTDGSGVTGTSDLRALGPTVQADSGDFGAVSAADELTLPVYPTLGDVSTTLPEGTQVYVQDEDRIYVEDGT